MATATQNIQEKIIHEALKDIVFDGLSWDVIVRASEKSGYDADVALSVFPDKVTSFLTSFSDLIDKQMMDKLKSVPALDMKVRERIRHAVWIRFEILEPYKEMLRLSLSHWMNPMKKPAGMKMVWSTSDKIWKWAGDTATDYNKYTKRGLLSGVITATMLVWINDKTQGHQKTADFLDRRIDNVLVVGKLAGKILSKNKS